MALTTQQLQTLKTYILTVTEWAALPLTGDAADYIATQLRTPASPAFTVWKSRVTIEETGSAFNGAEWAGMTSANHTRLQSVAQYLSSYNPSSADIRAMFNDIWSGAGGTLTRAALLTLWKRPANKLEKLFAAGTGSDAVPATLVVEGFISYQEVEAARVL
jgi:hypothetical protein